MTRFNRWVNKEMERLRQLYGGCCQMCGGLYDLEFAHLKPTGLRGKSRGKNYRVLDIRKHPDHYQLLCMDCHDALDGRRRRRRQSEFIRRPDHEC